MRNINKAALYHMPWLEYRHATPEGRVCLRLRAARGDFDRVSARCANQYTGADAFEHAVEQPMEVAFRDELFDWWECVFTPEDPRLKYLFVLRTGERTYHFDAEGLRADAKESAESAFAFAWVWPAEAAPEWARGCVGYQIFPDRFRRAGPADAALEPWSSARYESERRFGGDLRGMTEAVPYLRELGVDVVYLNPIFLSDSAHRYNTFDYYRIDPLLGDESDLRALADALHAAGMKLVLDGVFNHSGTRFQPFVDAQEGGEGSPCRDWFFFDDSDIGYRTFAFARYMPKLNLRNADCARYFLDVGRYWLERCGVDGWRLDVSPEVWLDFWRAFRKMMKSVNPESLMIAECWDDSREWLTPGDMFDSTMHYVLSRAIWARWGDETLSVPALDARINRAMALYPHHVEEALWNFLGSHDTQRFRTRAGGSVKRLKAASFLQLTLPGVPILYYGDELGMEGGDDPDCRRPMRWDDVEGNDVLAHYKRLIALRRQSPALRHGALRTLEAQRGGLYAFLRVSDGQTALVILNAATRPCKGSLRLPQALQGRAALTNALTGAPLPVANECLSLSLDVGEGAIVLY
ncbi:MAG: alpha amylase N-terminal ig-like domain-containing protein [Eubacteriales bacterium]|nr:alpha amylase N-terminal ig-like domain-containing protein [Eubacteriales bacterium]